MATIAAALSFMLISGAATQQAFAHATTTLTLDEDPVDGKKIRVTVGHSNEPAFGAKPGIHDGKHNFEVSIADSDTRMPLSGASLKADKYFFNDIKSFKKAKSLKDADDSEKGITVGSVFGSPGIYMTRQVQTDGIYGYRLYGAISYFGEATINIDSTIFCTTPEGDTKKFNKGSWSGSFGCTEDIDDILFPERNGDVNPRNNDRDGNASLELNAGNAQVQQIGFDSESTGQATPLGIVAMSTAVNGATTSQVALPAMGLQLLMFSLPAVAAASYVGIRILRHHKRDESV